MIGQTKKKLIIVVDEKSTVYGELLSALITAKDDREDNTVGIKDGTVETVIWTEKIYADNQAQLGSGNKVVFLGKNDTSNTVIPNINCKNDFAEYGIYYGYASNKAVVYVVDARLSADKDKYEKFYSKYSEYLTSIGTEFVANQIKNKVEIKSENVAESDKEYGAFAKKTLGIFYKIDKAVAKGISVLVNTKEITDQQYRLATIAFYMKALADFMGE